MIEFIYIVLNNMWFFVVMSGIAIFLKLPDKTISGFNIDNSTFTILKSVLMIFYIYHLLVLGKVSIYSLIDFGRLSTFYKFEIAIRIISNLPSFYIFLKPSSAVLKTEKIINYFILK